MFGEASGASIVERTSIYGRDAKNSAWHPEQEENCTHR